MIPDWQLPAGVDRGLHDYMQSTEMVGGYDAMMAASPLALYDVAYCRRWLTPPGRVIDLGCGTGRLAKVLVKAGYDYVGVDLSEEMLAAARRNVGDGAAFVRGNLVELQKSVTATADHAACLFSTLGMIIGEHNRRAAVKNVFGLLRLGGRFVLHVHNRHFRGLGVKGWLSGDITSRQAYGGAPLTIHHFANAEAVELLTTAGFQILDVTPVGINGPLRRPRFLPGLRAYGYLIAAERPESSVTPTPS